MDREGAAPGRDADWKSCLSRRSSSFRTAASLFPPELRDDVRAVYAYCRRTDDIVDGPAAGQGDRRTELERWVRRSRAAYRGDAPTDADPVLVRAMGRASEEGVPFDVVEDLARGMEMDLRGVRYERLADLERYAYRVAATVGLWLVRLWGYRDAWLLDRAADLGIAMQITNVARDVAEDWRRGRLYLPASLLRRHRLEPAEVGAMVEGRRPVDDRYRSAVDDLLGVAEERYARARPGLLDLPTELRRPVAVAARVYRACHGTLRSDPDRGLRDRRLPGPARSSVAAAIGLVSAEVGAVARQHRIDWHHVYRWASRTVGEVSA